MRVGGSGLAARPVAARSARRQLCDTSGAEPLRHAAAHHVAGLESGRLAAYRIDQNTGLLQPLEVYPVGTRPMWVMILSLA